MKMRKILPPPILILLAFSLQVFGQNGHYVYEHLRYELINSVTARTQQGFDDNEFHSYGKNCIYTQRESYTIPDEISYGDGGKSARVVTIGMLSFLDCFFLKHIYFGSNVKQISSYAFKNCTALESIDFPANVETVAEGAFTGCSSLKQVYYSTDLVTTLPNHLFENCTSLEEVELPESLETIYDAFNGCTALRYLYIPSKVRYISSEAFKNSPFIQKIVHPDRVTLDPSVAEYIVSYPSDAQYISGTVVSADDETVYCFSKKKSGILKVGDRVKHIGDYAGTYLENVDKLVLPYGLESIGDKTFRNCPSLKEVICQTPVPPVGTDMFDKALLTDGVLYVPTGSKAVYQAAEGWRDFADIREYMPLLSIKIEQSDILLTVGDEIQFTSIFTPFDPTYQDLEWRVGNQDVLTVDENGKVTAVGKGRTTVGCTSVHEPWVTASVYVFVDTFQDDDYIYEILSSGEGGNEVSMTSYRHRGEVTSGPHLDWDLFIPETVTFGDKVFTITEIGEGCFSGTNMANVTLPNTIRNIRKDAFRYCMDMRSINIPEGVECIEAGAFGGCYSLASASFASLESLLNIKFGSENSNPAIFGHTLIIDNEPVSEIIVPDGVEEIKDYAFDSCRNLKSVVASPSVKRIGNYAFNGCTGLQTVVLGQNIESIGYFGFYQSTPSKFYITTQTPPVVNLGGLGNPEEIRVQSSNAVAEYKKASGWESFTISTMSVPGEWSSSSTQLDYAPGTTVQLSATLKPSYVSLPYLFWTSTNPDIATVDQNGLVTFKDGADMEEESSFKIVVKTLYADFADLEFKVKGLELGDSNNDGYVTVTDAVNIANYAVGNDVSDFFFRAADVNADGNITLSDASGTIKIVLGQSYSMNMASRARSINAVEAPAYLEISDYSAVAGEKMDIAVKLHSDVDLVALQADVCVPEGMVITGINSGKGAENHSLSTSVIDNRTMRVVLFNPSNVAFDGNDEVLISLEVKVNEIPVGAIEMGNIFASDAEANEFRLTATGGENETSTSGVNVAVNDDNTIISSEGNMIVVRNASGKQVGIYNINGSIVANFVSADDIVEFEAASGLYIVKAGEKVEKVIIK